jgi:hypothetical protein
MGVKLFVVCVAFMLLGTVRVGAMLAWLAVFPLIGIVVEIFVVRAEVPVVRRTVVLVIMRDLREDVAFKLVVANFVVFEE